MNDIFDFNFDRSGDNIDAPKKRHSFMLYIYPFFQYCDSNNRLFSITTCNVVTLNLFML